MGRSSLWMNSSRMLLRADSGDMWTSAWSSVTKTKRGLVGKEKKWGREGCPIPEKGRRSYSLFSNFFLALFGERLIVSAFVNSPNKKKHERNVINEKRTPEKLPWQVHNTDWINVDLGKGYNVVVINISSTRGERVIFVGRKIGGACIWPVLPILRVLRVKPEAVCADHAMTPANLNKRNFLVVDWIGCWIIVRSRFACRCCCFFPPKFTEISFALLSSSIPRPRNWKKKISRRYRATEVRK